MTKSMSYYAMKTVRSISVSKPVFTTIRILLKGLCPKLVFKEQGIIAELIELNDPEHIRRSLGNYLIGHFKYEFFSNDYIGVDFETGRWFNRNLRIFRNIQRIETGPSDRILVIFGAGHLNLLNYLFECSPEYRLEEANKYLM